MNLQQIFLENDRWQFIWHGLEITLLITIFSVIIGLAFGLLLALMRQSSWRPFRFVKSGSLREFAPIGSVAKIYIAIIRGTPALVQLLIFYYVIFGSMPTVPKLWIAVLAFGFNSAAYVAEIIRGGIESIDHGQAEAARSLGLTYTQTMWHIILPQAFRNAIPSLTNEFVTLLKDTSIVGWIGMNDLMRGADNIRFQTGTAFESLFAVAILYFVMTSLFTRMMNNVERSFRVSDRN